MYQDLIQKKKKLAVIGLGYVGLPIALEFARKLSVVGFDIHKGRIALMKKGEDPSNELSKEDFSGTDIVFTDSIDQLKKANFFVVAVPTPVDKHKVPDLHPLLSASETVGRALKKGDYVVFESTVYPGCTEEDCVPVLEKFSGLKARKDFKIGYSPERINPGDKEHTLSSVIKVVSGCDKESLEEIARVYLLVARSGVYKAPSIKVAEAAKIIENTQRDLNIALMNELSMIFERMHINTYDVLEAASTKWKFLRFFPGLVGGHCIGVDPYYLTYKSKELGYEPEVILSGRRINDEIGGYVARKTIQLITKADKDVTKSRILVMGATFKENVSDIRNSKVADIIQELKNYSAHVDIVDPCASSEELEEEYGFSLIEKPRGHYDAVILAVSHDQFLGKGEEYFKKLCSPGGILVDIKGAYRNKIHQLTYWSL